MTEISKEQIITDASNTLDELFSEKNWLNLKNDITSLLITPRSNTTTTKEIFLMVKHDLVLSYKDLPYRDTLLEYGSALASENHNNNSFKLFDYEGLLKYLDLSNRSSFELSWSIINSTIIYDAFNQHENLKHSAMQINESQYKRVVKNYFFTLYQLLNMIKEESDSKNFILQEIITQYMRLSCLIEWSYFPPMLHLQSEFNLTELGKKFAGYFDNLLELDKTNVNDGHIDLLDSYLVDLVSLAKNRFKESPNWIVESDDSIYAILTNSN
tara:strand:+ start:540 stop:1349 length:810 start_codon:yes stop_codon:yes gene_type:complete